MIADRLKQGHINIADGFADVTVLFADIVGFTEISSRTSPEELVELLNKIFSAFDRLSEQYGLEKIKTIGDNYMVAGGLPLPCTNHAESMAEMALEMQQEIMKFRECDKPLNIRIGINTGSVVAGVIGTKKFIYDLWGDAVNTASRMESQGLPGKIQVSRSTYELLSDKYLLEKRGKINVKGKGAMTTYWLKGRKL
jgi:class 3 adenylate cyclase